MAANRVRKACATLIFGSEVATVIADPESRASSQLLNDLLGLKETDHGLLYPDIYPFMLGPGDEAIARRLFRAEGLMKVSALFILNVLIVTILFRYYAAFFMGQNLFSRRAK